MSIETGLIMSVFIVTLGGVGLTCLIVWLHKQDTPVSNNE